MAMMKSEVTHPQENPQERQKKEIIGAHVAVSSLALRQGRP